MPGPGPASEPPAVGDDGANVVEQQAGGGNPASGAAPVAQTIPSAASTATGSNPGAAGSELSAKIEIDLLTYGVLERLANVIAERCDTREEDEVLIATPTDMATIAAVRALHQVLVHLALQIERLVPESAPGRPDKALNLATAIKAGTEGVSAIVTAAKGVIDLLAVTEESGSRAVAIEERTMAELVAIELRTRSKPIIVSAGTAAISAETAATSVIARLADARERLRAARGEEQDKKVQAALATVDRLLDPILQGSAAAVAAGLGMMALIDLHPEAPILVARTLASGGTGWNRTNLLTRLGCREPLSFSAGAAVIFSLTNRDGTLIAGNLVYDSSGRVEIPSRSGVAKLTNVR